MWQSLVAGRDRARMAVVWLTVIGLASSVVWQRALGVCFWLIAIIGAILAWQRVSVTSDLSRAYGSAITPSRGVALIEPSLWWIALVPTLLNLVSVLWFDLEWRAMNAWPWLMLPLVVLAARWARLRLVDIGVGAGLACLFAALVFAFAWTTSPDPRTHLPMNAIIFAQAACTCALVCLWLAGRCRPHARRLMALCALIGLLAALAIGLRALLTILPLYLVAFAGWPRQGASSLRGWLILALVCISVAAVFITWGSPDSFFGRMMQMQAEIASYESGHVQFSSTGSRLALWNSALRFAQEHPIFGIGADQFGHGLQRLRDQGLFPQDVFLFDHAHNSYLNILAEFGVIGILVVAVVVGGLWRLLVRDGRAAHVLGRYVLILWLTLAMTNDALGHQQTIRLITLLLGLCLGCLGSRTLEVPSATGENRSAPASGV